MTNHGLDTIDQWVIAIGFIVPTIVIAALWLGFIPL